MVKYLILCFVIVFSLISCAYFDPMHGLSYLEYGDTYSLSFSGESEVLFEYGQVTYNNVVVYEDNVYVVYYNETGNYIVLTRSQDGGSTWSDARLTPGSTNASVVCMSETDGTIYISYRQMDYLYCIVSYDGGNTIRLTQVASMETSGDGYTGISGYGDLIYISYSALIDTSPPLCDIMCAYSTDRGQTFSTVVVDPSMPSYASPSSITYNTSTGRVHMTYQVENDEVRHAWSDDLENWAKNTLPGTEHQTSRILLGSDGNIHLAYAGTGGVYYFYSDDDGASWSATEDVDSGISYATDLSLVEDGGTIYAAYYDYSDSELEFSKGPGAWSPGIIDVNSARGSGTARMCSIGASGGLLFVSYVDDGDNSEIDEDNRLRLARSTDNGMNWNQ